MCLPSYPSFALEKVAWPAMGRKLPLGQGKAFGRDLQVLFEKSSVNDID